MVFQGIINSPVRQINARVEFYSGSSSTPSKTFYNTDYIKEFTIDRVGDGKFFGYGICQKANVKIQDIDRHIGIVSGETRFRILYHSTSVESNYTFSTPFFNVTEVNRNENTNELSITGYDPLYNATTMTVADIYEFLPTEEEVDEETGETHKVFKNLNHSELCYSINEALGFDQTYFGYSSKLSSIFSETYPDNINLTGSESIREVLDAVAEATGSIYYIAMYGTIPALTFTVVHNTNTSMLTIDKEKYFTLEVKDNRRLTTIIHATDLGDNLSVTTGATGSTQFIRNNPFIELREDADVALENILNVVAGPNSHLGLTIPQFECDWIGGYKLDIGSKVKFETKNGQYIEAFVLDDVITYNGTLRQKTRWAYIDNEEETAANPVTLGDALKQTYARVDKVNKQVEIVASDITATNEEIAAIKVNTDNISLSVESIEKNLSESTESLNGQIEEVRNKAELALTPENVKIAITETLKTGVEEYTTETGFTFNNEGLTIDKSDSEMATQITEDGMVVYKNDEAMLTANNTGVYAQNLHATTYLIIGKNSRFEDYEKDGEARTGCFWLGGN